MQRNWLILTLLLLTLPAQAGVEMFFLHSDHLGTPRVITDTNQQVVWKGTMKPFGEMEVDVEAITNHRRFPGQRYDIESRLHYNYFRDYDPSLGRYIQSDPIGLSGGFNTYAYAYQSPVGLIDPLGLATCWMSVSQGWMKCISDIFDKPMLEIPVASGNNGGGDQCMNNPDCDARSNRGPIPLGTWEWCDGYTSSPDRRNLCATLGTNSKGRTALQTHACKYPFGPGKGPRFCSEGCVTGTYTGIDQLNKYIDQEPDNTLYVYP